MGRRSRSRSPRRVEPLHGKKRVGEGGERRRSRSPRERERRARRSRSPEYNRRRRSRSPRRRSRSPDRERDRGRYDRRDRSRSRERGDAPAVLPNQIYQRPPLDESAFEGKSEEEIEMMKLMGFGGFDTTKGKQVPGNDVGVVNITHKRRYRQYMNRRGGFNRPLDSIA